MHTFAPKASSQLNRLFSEAAHEMLSPVFFMTEVKLLRMELIFARSTLARLGKASAGD